MGERQYQVGRRAAGRDHGGPHRPLGGRVEGDGPHPQAQLLREQRGVARRRVHPDRQLPVRVDELERLGPGRVGGAQRLVAAVQLCQGFGDPVEVRAGRQIPHHVHVDVHRVVPGDAAQHVGLSHGERTGSLRRALEAHPVVRTAVGHSRPLTNLWHGRRRTPDWYRPILAQRAVNGPDLP